MCVLQHGWTGYRAAPLLLPLLALLLLSTPPRAQAAIHIPEGYKVNDMSQPPVMEEIPESFIAFSLEDIVLPCEAKGIPTPTFRWVKDGREFGPEMNGSGTLRAAEGEEHSFYQGVYRCYASNSLGTAMSPSIRLITETQPIPPKRPGVPMKAHEGDSLILPCNPPNSSSTPLIHWMDKKMVHIKQSERVVVGQDGNMYFANVLRTDSKQKYYCIPRYLEARIMLPMEPISLTVAASNDPHGRKPHLFLPRGSHTSKRALKDHSLILECIPKGLPTPTVQWRKKDGHLAETGGKVDNHNRWLSFESITQEDDGEYECIATNEHGSVAHAFTVTVEAAPYWVKEPQSLLYAPGETVRIDCQADGIPTPTIVWNINGQPLTDVDEDVRRSVSGGVLILRDVEFADTAVYQCEASNVHGNILINTYIYVIELPPQILSNDGEVYRVAEGRDVKLHCDAFGSPRPHVTWEGEGSLPLLSDPRVALLTSGMLELSNASREDRGAYTCTIRNHNISIVAYLEVLNRTVILAAPHHVRVFKGNSSQLDCHFYKDPHLDHPQIVWKRDGHKNLDPLKFTVLRNGTLQVKDLELEDSGHYSCEVITELDNVEATGSITVVDRPAPPYALGLSDIQDRSLTLSWIPGPSHNGQITDFYIEAQEEQLTEEAQEASQESWERWREISGDINHLELTLQPYSKYRFRVIGVNEFGHSDPSQESESHATPPAAPDTNPSDVRSNSLEPGTLTIEWKEMKKRMHNGPGFQYKVSWRSEDALTTDWHHSYVLAPPFLVNGTEAYTPFEIKVQAVNSEGEALPPNTVTGHSGEAEPLEAPGEVEVTVMNSTVRVTWKHAQRVRGQVLGYKIYIKRLGSQRERGRRALGQMHNDREEPGAREEEESRVVEVLGERTSAEVPGLRFYSRYELSVTVFNSKGEGPPSQPAPFSTPEGVPDPPASLTFESPSETELTLHWTPPIQTNGILLEYIVQYQREMMPEDVQMLIIRDASTTYVELDNLDPHSNYIFKVSGRTAAGDGPAITRKNSTLLDGVPPNNITLLAGERSVNFSWVPGIRYRNYAFQFQYLRKGGTGGEWEESDFVDTSQGLFTLTGLQPGTTYHFIITHANQTYWDKEIQTSGPELSEVAGGFATQGWFIGLISAIVLLMLILLILCFIKRSKGGKYAVKDKEEGQVDSEARPMKDETFGEYRSLESDGDEKRTASQPSLCVESKLGSDDSLAEYGDSVDIQFNEDGSFIGQYSGRGPVPPGHESSGPASPDNGAPPPPIAPSMSTILDRPS